MQCFIKEIAYGSHLEEIYQTLAPNNPLLNANQKKSMLQNLIYLYCSFSCFGFNSYFC